MPAKPSFAYPYIVKVLESLDPDEMCSDNDKDCPFQGALKKTGHSIVYVGFTHYSYYPPLAVGRGVDKVWHMKTVPLPRWAQKVIMHIDNATKPHGTHGMGWKTWTASEVLALVKQYKEGK